MDTTTITAGAPGGIGAAPAATTPAAPAWHDGLITKDAAGVESLRPYAEWQGTAPEPLRKFINDNMTAARARTDGMVKLPGPDAKPEEWEPVWKALGRPDKAEEYGITKPEKLPDGVTWNDAEITEFQRFAHESGMPKALAQKVAAWQTERVGKVAAEMRAAGEKFVADERAALEKHFGPHLADAASAAQEYAKSKGRDPDRYNPVAGNFAGVQALQDVTDLITELKKHTQEGSFGGPGGQSPTQFGKVYADAVIAGKHPDSDKYYGKNGVAQDYEFVQKITAEATR